MKIISIFFVFSLWISVFGVTNIDENSSGNFNELYEKALQYEWKVKPQPYSGVSLFDEARQEVQNTLKIPKDTKPTEAIYSMGNTFCRGLYGTCDDNSLHARLVAGCTVARDTALKNMDSNFIKNNTALFLDSYTSCQTLANDVLLAYKNSASIGIAKWKGGNIRDSQESFIEKYQNIFQEKVSNVGQTFVKKLTNFVNSVQGLTEQVFK